MLSGFVLAQEKAAASSPSAAETLKKLEKRYDGAVSLYRKGKLEEAKKEFIAVRDDAKKAGVALKASILKGIDRYLEKIETKLAREEQKAREKAASAKREKLKKKLESDFRYAEKLYKSGRYDEAKRAFVAIAAEADRNNIKFGFFRNLALKDYLKKCDKKIAQAAKAEAEARRKAAEAEAKKRAAEEKAKKEAEARRLKEEKEARKKAAEAEAKRKAAAERKAKERLKANLLERYAAAEKLYRAGNYSKAKSEFEAIAAEKERAKISLGFFRDIALKDYPKKCQKKVAEARKAEAEAKKKAAEAEARRKAEEQARLRKEREAKERARREAALSELRLAYKEAEKLFSEGKYEEAKRRFLSIRAEAAERDVKLSTDLERGIKKYLSLADRKIAERKAAREKAARETEEALLEQIFAQERRAMAQALYEEGVKALGAERYDEAIAKFESALKYNPDHAEAKSALEKARKAKPPVTTVEEEMLKEEAKMREVRRQEAIASLEALVNEGLKLEAKGEYSAAQEKYRLVLTRLEVSPALTAADRQQISERAKKLLEKSEERRIKAEKEAERIKRKEAEELAERERRLRLKAERERLDALFRKVAQLSEERDYEGARAVVDTILKENPRDRDALVLLGKIQRALDREKEWEQLRIRHREAEAQTHKVTEMEIPYSETITYPTAEEWKRKTRQRQEITGPGIVNRSPEDEAIISKMKTIRKSVDFTETPIQQVVDFLQDVYGVNIVLDQTALEWLGDIFITLKLRDVTLETVLDFVTRQHGLAYVVQKGVVFISTPDQAREEVVRVSFDVKDLVIRVPDFAGPTLGTEGVSGEESGGTTTRGGRRTTGTRRTTTTGGEGYYGGETETGAGAAEAIYEVSPEEAGQELVDIIMDTVHRQEWDKPDVSIQYSNGYLIVTQTREVLEEIQKFLADLRAARALQVSLDIRFITISDEWLQDIGFQFFDPVGLAGIVMEGGTAPNLRTALLSTTFPVSTEAAAYGLNLRLQIIDDVTFTGLLHALQSSNEAHILEAPRLTVFNGQRAYIAVYREHAYISGVSSVTAESAVGLNYTFDTVEEGVTFDVRPFVSSDRRYVQLTLRPTVSRLLDLVDQPLAMAVMGQVFNATVQLPTIEDIEIRTTVSVPDEGTLMVGGLAMTRDEVSEMGVPVLGKLPIIKRLFSRKLNRRKRDNLIIFIRPQILIQEEWEPK